MNKFFVSSIICLLIFLTGCADKTSAVRQDNNYRRSFHLFQDYTAGSHVFYSVTDLPEYGKGDAFIYDNGLIETVIDRKGEEVVWQDNTHFRYTSFRNPVLNRKSWVWDDNIGRDLQTRVKYDVDYDFMWPLKVGDKKEFHTIETTFNNLTKQESKKRFLWHCEVPNTEIINTKIGKFDTFKIVCIRSSNYLRKMKYIINYAPVLNHWVRKTYVTNHGDDYVINLVEAGPRPSALSLKAKEELAKTVQYALEYKISGQEIVKFIPEEKLKITIIPKETFKTDKGYFCRKYEQKLYARTRTSTQEGTACKDKEGVWKTPRENLY